MEHVIGKIESLYEDLKLDSYNLDKSIKLAKEEKLSNNKRAEELDKRENVLIMRETVLVKYEDFEKEKDEFFKNKKDNKETASKLSGREQDQESLRIELNKLKIELDQRKIAISKQAIALKEREANFDKKKEDLRGLVTGQAMKELIKK